MLANQCVRASPSDSVTMFPYQQVTELLCQTWRDGV